MEDKKAQTKARVAPAVKDEPVKDSEGLPVVTTPKAKVKRDRFGRVEGDLSTPEQGIVDALGRPEGDLN